MWVVGTQLGEIVLQLARKARNVHPTTKRDSCRYQILSFSSYCDSCNNSLYSYHNSHQR